MRGFIIIDAQVLGCARMTPEFWSLRGSWESRGMRSDFIEENKVCLI